LSPTAEAGPPPELPAHPAQPGSPVWDIELDLN
jgi:hypothetical protein